MFGKEGRKVKITLKECIKQLELKYKIEAKYKKHKKYRIFIHVGLLNEAGLYDPEKYCYYRSIIDKLASDKMYTCNQVKMLLHLLDNPNLMSLI